MKTRLTRQMGGPLAAAEDLRRTARGRLVEIALIDAREANRSRPTCWQGGDLEARRPTRAMAAVTAAVTG